MLPEAHAGESQLCDPQLCRVWSRSLDKRPSSDLEWRTRANRPGSDQAVWVCCLEHRWLVLGAVWESWCTSDDFPCNDWSSVVFGELKDLIADYRERRWHGCGSLTRYLVLIKLLSARYWNNWYWPKSIENRRFTNLVCCARHSHISPLHASYSSASIGVFRWSDCQWRLRSRRKWHRKHCEEYSLRGSRSRSFKLRVIGGHVSSLDRGSSGSLLHTGQVRSPDIICAEADWRFWSLLTSSMTIFIL